MTSPTTIEERMNTDDLNKLKRLAEEATPGPWALDDLNTLNVISVHEDCYTPELGTYLNVSINGFYKDSRFIAAANPQTVLALLGRIEELEEALEKQHGDIGFLISTINGVREATGEGPEEEDAAIFWQINYDHAKETRRRARAIWGME